MYLTTGDNGAKIFSRKISGGPDMYKLKYDRPAALFSEALVLGNGSLGAAVYGGIENELIRLNCDTLWSGTVRNEDRKAKE